MDLTSKFLLFKKKEVFEKVMSQIPQGLRPIVLIEDTREMWSCGTYFSIGYPSIEITESSGSVKVSIGESYFWLSTSGDSISVRKGEGNRIIINSNALSRVDTLPPLTWNLEQRKLLHMESGATPGSYGQSSNTGNASIFVVPNISVDSTGHITSVKDVNVEIRDYVELLAPSTTSVDRNVLLSYNLVNTNSDSAQTRKANGLLFNDATKRLTVEGGITSNGLTQVNNGDLVVVGGYIIGNLKGEVEGEAKPKIHLSAKPEYGGASTELYGHVKLQDILNNKPDPSSNNTNVNDTNVVNAIAASPYMVWEALETAKNYADSLLGTNNAMLFKGSITAGASSPGNFTPAGVVGNTYVVTFSEETYTNSIGYVNGEPVEVGDLVICKKDTSEATSSTWQQIKENWTYVQTNTTGTVSGPSSSTVGLLAVFSNTTGKLIKGLQNGNVGLMLVIGNSGIPEWQDKPDKLAYSLVFKANSSPVIEFDGSSQKTLNLIQGDNVIISYDQLGNVTIAADPGSDTVNTAGATNKINTKLFLIGSESQTEAPKTFSNQYVYIGTDNCLYSSNKKVLTEHLIIYGLNLQALVGDIITKITTFNPNINNSSFTIVLGSNITLTSDSTSNKLTISAKDTKNTTGAGEKLSSKLFLVGSSSLADSILTYTNSKVYIGEDNKLRSNDEIVSTVSHNHNYAGSLLPGGPADNIAGGVKGSLPYLISSGVTYMLAPAEVNGYVLKFNTETGLPYWAPDINTTYITKVLKVNNTSYNVYTSSASLPTIWAPSNLGEPNQVLKVNSTGDGLTWGTDSNTDTKVLQSETTTTNYRPLILGYTNSATISDLNSKVTNLVYVSNLFYAKPSTGELWATKLYSGNSEVLTKNNYTSLLDNRYVTLNTNQTIIGEKTFSAPPIINTDFTTSYIRYFIKDTVAGSLGFNAVNSPAAYIGSTWYKLLHTGNYSTTLDTRYVKKAGDTMTGTLYMPHTLVGISETDANKYAGSNAYYNLAVGWKEMNQGLGLLFYRPDSTKQTGIAFSTTDSDHVDIFLEANSNDLSIHNLKGGVNIKGTTNLTYNENIVWHAGNDGAGSGLDADLLDGYHESAFVRSFGTGSPGYDCSTFNTRPIISFTYSNNAPFTGVFIDINSSGYGFYLGTGYLGNGALYYKRHGQSGDGGMGSWQQLARVTDNVASATKLATARTIWGQSFDGTANVNGVLNITGNSNYSEGIRIHAYAGISSVWFNCTNNSGFDSGMWGITSDSTGFRFRYGTSSPSDLFKILNNGNVGIGTTSPSSKLDINGNGILSNTDSFLQIGKTDGTGNSGKQYKVRLGLGTSCHTGSQYWCFGIDDNVTSAGESILRIGYTKDSTIFSINANGKIGLGIVNPSYNLHVAGTMGVTGATNISVNTTYPLILKGADKFSVINFKNNAGSNVTDIGWLNDTRGNSAYMANISSNGVVSVANDGLWYSNDAGTFRKYSVLHTGNYTSLVVRKAGDTMAGALNFANNVWNRVGDDVYIGDHNVANYLCIKANSGSTVGINFFNSSNGDVGKLASVNGTLQWKGTNISLDGHTHGLLHNNFATTIANTTTDSGWSMINGSYNGFILKSLRTSASAPSWILGNYAAGICFGGADTKGVISVAYSSAQVRVAGGNGSKPVWSCDLWHNKNFNPNTKFNTSGGTISGAVTINNTLSVSKIKATSTYSSNYVFCADGSIRNFPALFSTNILWASYKVNTGGSGSYSRLSGNYTFITGRTREGTGSLIVTISVPSGYSKTQIMMFATGHHRQDHWANPVYASIQPDYGASNSIRIMTADDSSLNDAECIVNFILVKTS